LLSVGLVRTLKQTGLLAEGGDDEKDSEENTSTHGTPASSEAASATTGRTGAQVVLAPSCDGSYDGS